MRPLPLLAMALSACATASPDRQVYRALGTEPFWSIEIAGDRMTYETPDGTFAVDAPAPTVTAAGRRYETPRVTLEATHWVCSDGMSDNLYADTVRAMVDGTALFGCGGGIVPRDTIAFSTWWIEEIEGLPLDDARYRLAFAADRLSGHAGCNRFSGPYSRAGDALDVGPLAATRMACQEPRMEHERRALRVLQGRLRLHFDADDRLVLTGDGGGLKLRRSFEAPYAETPADRPEPPTR